MANQRGFVESCCFVMMMRRPAAVAGILLLVLSSPSARSGSDWAQPPMGLSHYLHRLPAKSLPQLMEESGEGAGISQNDYQIPTESVERQLPRLVEALRNGSREKARKQCDDLLESIRRSSLVSAAWTAVVLDVRDCLADKKFSNEDAADYLDFRLMLGALHEDPEETGKLLEIRFDQDLPDREYAHLLYLDAALQFLRGSDENQWGYEQFREVIRSYPDHPRAETALLMAGRAAFRSSLRGWGEPHSVEGLALAEATFREYLETYPEGRYLGDVYGWLGGVETKREKFAEALGWYLKQLDTPNHPEIQRTASRMVERLVGISLAHPDDSIIDGIASRPQVAMGTVYWLVHAPEANLYNGFYDHPEVVKRWRAHWLPLLADGVARHEDLWKENGATPWFLAIQAHAASNAGDQAKALALTNRNPDLLARSDDLAFVNALALQRSGKSAEAVDAFRALLTDFPKSALRPGAQFRLATAHRDAGQSDAAVAVLLQLLPASREEGRVTGPYYQGWSPYPPGLDLPSASSALSPDTSGATEIEVRQYLDALLRFGPLDELAGLAGMRAALPPEAWPSIRLILLGRALSESHAELAIKLADAKQAPVARKILRLDQQAKSSPTPDNWLALAAAWADARGTLTSPSLLLNREDIFIFNTSDAPEKLRLENAQVIGFGENAAERIIGMDELTHAMNAWEKAADAADPGSSARAAALFELLEAMPLIAMATPYGNQYAMDHDWNARADRLYRQLQDECGATLEARAAARPRFRPRPNGEGDEPVARENPATADPFDQVSPPWRDFHYGLSQDYLRHREFHYPSLLESEPGFRSEADTDTDTRDSFKRILSDLYQVDATIDAAALVEQMEGLRKRSRQLYDHWNKACVHFAIEDLAEFVGAGPLPPARVRTRYFDIRRHFINTVAWNGWDLDLRPVSPELEHASSSKVDEFVAAEISEALADPIMAPVHDRLDCLRLFLLANQRFDLDIEPAPDDDDHGSGEQFIGTRDYAAVAEETTAFLETYPRSSKREAVWLLKIRSEYRSRRPLLYSAAVEFPENPFVGARYIRKEYPNQLSWDSVPVERAIAGYLAEFPTPRYQGEVTAMKAALAFRGKNWDTCLAHTLDILDHPEWADLHPDAHRRLANVFAQLAESNERADVLASIKRTPASHPLLARYLDETDKRNWRMPPLSFVSEWVRDSVGL